MKNLLLICGFVLAVGMVNAQNIPIDYEAGGYGATWNWTVFENDANPVLEIIPNPDPSGINTSATVAKFTALQAGNPWAGCETLHGAGIGTFTIDSSNAIIRISVWKSVMSDVGIKLVRFDNWSLGEIKIPNTTVNQWEQITFDFSSHMGNTYDQLVIFPDFNARSADNIIYFDDVFGDVATATAIGSPISEAPKLYPNPNSGSFRIASNNTIEVLEVMDAFGSRVMLQENLEANAMINTADLAAGLYFVRTVVDGKTTIQKMLQK